MARVLEADATLWPPYVCPRTGRDLQLLGQRLVASDTSYPVVGGIPRFVSSEAYAENFGIQWHLFPKTQLDSHSGLPLSASRLRRCCGDELFARLRGLHVLEAGCGAGRFTEVLLRQGAHVTSVDLSSAVEVNKANFPLSTHHRVAQADIQRLPFAPRGFDVVVCLGVLQHTPNPERTMELLYEQVKPGGALILDHYTYRRRWSSVKPIVRAWLKRKPQGRVMPTIQRLVDFYHPLHRATRRFYPAWFVLCRVSPITSYYRTLPELPEPLQREWSLLDTHDTLTDWYKHLRTRDEIERHLRAVGTTDVRCWYAGNGVEARAWRPA